MLKKSGGLEVCLISDAVHSLGHTAALLSCQIAQQKHFNDVEFVSRSCRLQMSTERITCRLG